MLEAVGPDAGGKPSSRASKDVEGLSSGSFRLGAGTAHGGVGALASMATNASFGPSRVGETGSMSFREHRGMMHLLSSESGDWPRRMSPGLSSAGTASGTLGDGRFEALLRALREEHLRRLQLAAAGAAQPPEAALRLASLREEVVLRPSEEGGAAVVPLPIPHKATLLSTSQEASLPQLALAGALPRREPEGPPEGPPAAYSPRLEEPHEATPSASVRPKKVKHNGRLKSVFLLGQDLGLGSDAPKVERIPTAPENSKVEAVKLAARKASSSTLHLMRSHNRRRRGLFAPVLIKERLLSFFMNTSSVLGCIGSLVICANLICLGIEVQIEGKAAGDKYADGFYRANIAFNVYYVLELALRIGLGPRSFCGRSGRAMNIMDACLGALSLLELTWAASPAVNTANLRMMRLARAVRVARVVRVVVSCTVFLDFYKMVFAIAGAASTLAWAVAVMALMIYSFSVLLAQGARDYLDSSCGEHHSFPQEVCQGLEQDFGDLFRTSYSLFKSITGGVNWGEISHNLWYTGGLFPAVFITFVVFSVLGMMNIVTSIFIDSVMHTSEHFRELAVMEAKTLRDRNLTRLKRLFTEIDTNGDGTLTLEELRDCFQDEDVELWFQALGVTPADAAVLFAVMDYDGSGKVDSTEFFAAFSKLQGTARSFDVNVLVLEAQEVLRRFEDLEVLLLECQAAPARLRTGS